jgi:hypothetical protein
MAHFIHMGTGFGCVAENFNQSPDRHQPTMTTDLTTSDLSDLAARINESHHLAMSHASKAMEQATACGEMLLETKAKVPHGHWLRWLRENVTFGERSAQGYMRIAQAPRRPATGNIRDALKQLATPRRHRLDAMLQELGLFNDRAKIMKASRPDDVSKWSIEDAKNCADSIRDIDEILHRYSICDSDDCTVCDAEVEASNTQRVADLDEKVV